MIINFRYHFFTVTAIFVALGLGILIGSSIVGNDGLVKEQRRLVKNINDEFSRLQDENSRLAKGIRTLETELISWKSTGAEIYSILIKDYLKEKDILLIFEEMSEDNIKEISSFFKLLEAKSIIKRYEEIKEKISEEILYSDYFISWNLNKDLNEELKNLGEKPFIIYNGESTQGLILAFIKELIKNDK